MEDWSHFSECRLTTSGKNNITCREAAFIEVARALEVTKYKKTKQTREVRICKTSTPRSNEFEVKHGKLIASEVQIIWLEISHYGPDGNSTSQVPMDVQNRWPWPGEGLL